MCVVVTLTGSLAARNRGARSRFEKEHPGGMKQVDLSGDVRILLREGRRFPALKQFRKETGLGLKDAKEILDRVTS